jgi:hypothetical protein
MHTGKLIPKVKIHTCASVLTLRQKLSMRIPANILGRNRHLVGKMVTYYELYVELLSSNPVCVCHIDFYRLVMYSIVW